MPDHTRKVNDDHATWTQMLDDVDTDLTTVSGVDLYVEAPDGSIVVSGAAAEIVDADTVSYAFAAGDLSQSGSHNAEFHVNYSDDSVEIAPQDGYFSVQVLEVLN